MSLIRCCCVSAMRNLRHREIDDLEVRMRSRRRRTCAVKKIIHRARDRSGLCYIINHSGAGVVSVHPRIVPPLTASSARLENVRHFIALDDADEADLGGWLAYEKLLADGSEDFSRPAFGERDLLTINYTSGTTSRPKGVMITHRNAYMNVVGTLIHLPMTSADRYLWTLPMFHANGWTFTCTVTAVGPCTSACRSSMPRSCSSSLRASASRCFARRGAC